MPTPLQLWNMAELGKAADRQTARIFPKAVMEQEQRLYELRDLRRGGGLTPEQLDDLRLLSYDLGVAQAAMGAPDLAGVQREGLSLPRVSGRSNVVSGGTQSGPDS